MIKEFKREDYIYVRVMEDFEHSTGILYKKDQILRYRKEWLIQEIMGRQFTEVFNRYHDSLDYVKNNDCDENDILYHQIYQSIQVAQDRYCELYLWPEDYFYLNEWLQEHIGKDGIDTIIYAEKNLVSDTTHSKQLIQLTEGCPYKDLHVSISFKKGEILDFSDPAVFTLFYNMDWMKFLSKVEVITGKEKEQLFVEDFSNAIYAQQPITASYWEDDPTRDLCEYHYFKLNDGVKVRNSEELSLDSISYDMDFVYDKNGFIQYVSTNTSEIDTSYRSTEQEILKFAHRISVEEARKCHAKVIADYVERERASYQTLLEGTRKENMQLQKLYELKKDDPSYFPGVHGIFVHNDGKQENYQSEYTLSQVQQFYRNLACLDFTVVREMCFYGGTVPYILNNETESRRFGDIDIFVPVAHMEKLREEFLKQESFEMLTDSKLYTQFGNLTSRISKNSVEVMKKGQQTEQFIHLLRDAMLMPQDGSIIDVDEGGLACDPFEVFWNETKPYYNKFQDFGFKAKLFGLPISVFPMYQFNDHIMAKSFNISESCAFLLGVHVLNNTIISDFVKKIEIYGSTFHILPLEYTLVSKMSAVDEGRSYRIEKDKEDVSYILTHKDELGVTEEYLQVIADNYPDYSISIAYQINDHGNVSTLSGEKYKQLVLTKRNVS